MFYNTDYTEFKQVSFETISENRIFGNGYRLNKDGNLIATEKTCKTNVTMQTSSRSKEDLTKLIVKLVSFAQAILLAQLQFSYLQRLKIQALKLSKCYHAKARLDKDVKNELFRWIENLRLYNGKSLILPPTDLCISMDVGGGTCQGISTAGLWS